MQPQELKTLVEAGAYKPDPGEIAAAMLQRRGLRELLTGLHGSEPDGQSQSQPQSAAMRPRAA